ncbi:hypothetical protein AIE71_21800 [Salmonella enterica subsp. enterica]|nr:hypothetical protein [Salmonella enterica subsp. enterica]EEA7994187.1 hypothetical protein [Salmonella enterica subsp. enterica]
MSRARKLTISHHDFYRLNSLSLACRGLESLLIAQDAELSSAVEPVHLAALLALVAGGIETAIQPCSQALNDD